MGEESWKALEAKTMEKQVPMDIIDIDQYKRSVGVIWIGMDPDRAGDQVNARTNGAGAR